MQPPPSQVTAEVMGQPLFLNQRPLSIGLLFSPTPTVAHDPVFLARCRYRVIAILHQGMTPETPLDWAVHGMQSMSLGPSDVVQLANSAIAGFDLYMAVVPCDASQIGADYDPEEHDASLLRLDLRGPRPCIRGRFSADEIALRRLSILHQRGARPVVAARVQANLALYESGSRGMPALVTFSDDPTVAPADVQRAATLMYEAKEKERATWPLAGIARAALDSDDGWQYHRRYTLPAHLTAGRSIYAADVWIHRPFLQDGYFSEQQSRFLPCLAESGSMGGIELIPHDRISHFWSPKQTAIFRSRP
jgi:hypothetical protein